MPGLEDLKRNNAADLKANLKTLTGLATPGDIVAHLKNTLWPYLESLSNGVIDELNDMDAALLEVARGEGDMLSGETAGVIANHVLISKSLAEALKARLAPTDDDAELGRQIDAFLVLCSEVEQILADITIDDDDAEEEDDDADPAE